MQLQAFFVKIWLGGIFGLIIFEKSEANVYCFFKMDEGPCRSAHPRWFFNYTAKECQTFTYGGCEGNRNKFMTKDRCEQRCRGNEVLENLTPAKACFLPKVVGRCRAAFPRWYFNKEKRSCVTFIYGGCQGNANNFLTQSDCEDFCQEFLMDRCRQPIIQASKKSCDDEEKGYRYGYDKATKKCVKFMHSSCKENMNHFATRKECLLNCANNSPCLRKTRYHRSRFHVSYFYNAEEDKCQETRTFLYKTKVWPNENRFRKMNQCVTECMPDYAPVEKVQMPDIPVINLE
uniref:Tissue factor pathway inhibitor n=1 Tax=Rhipicephalus appendiculatus TaxID=34631 RepID=A0A131YU26_RHIAP